MSSVYPSSNFNVRRERLGSGSPSATNTSISSPSSSTWTNDSGMLHQNDGIVPGDSLAPSFPSDLALLRQKNETLQIAPELVSAVARLGMFDRPSLSRILDTAQDAGNPPPRGELLTLLDATRGHKTAEANRALNESVICQPDSFVAAYLMPNERLISVLPFERASLAPHEEAKKGSPSPPSSTSRITGQGRIYLTTHRLLLLSNQSTLVGDYEAAPGLLKNGGKDNKAGSTSASEPPLMANIRRKIQELTTNRSAQMIVDLSGGLDGLQSKFSKLFSFLPCTQPDWFSQCKGEARERVYDCIGKATTLSLQRDELEAELRYMVELHPELQRRALLVEIMKLLHHSKRRNNCCAGPCCQFSCGCCSCEPTPEPYLVHIVRAENFSILPLPLDRFLHAELNAEGEARTSGAFQRTRTCCGLPCCYICSKHKFSPLAEIDPTSNSSNDKSNSHVDELFVTSESLLQFALLLPPWGTRAMLRVRVSMQVHMQQIASFLAAFHSHAPLFAIAGFNGVADKAEEFRFNSTATNSAQHMTAAAAAAAGYPPPQQAMTR